MSFQSDVRRWCLACFGAQITDDRQERNHRFLEEALELVQACGCPKNQAQQLLDYVYSRPAGKPDQEVGGALVTLAALCSAHGMDMANAGEAELADAWSGIDRIRDKHAGKPI